MTSRPKYTPEAAEEVRRLKASRLEFRWIPPCRKQLERPSDSSRVGSPKSPQNNSEGG